MRAIDLTLAALLAASAGAGCSTLNPAVVASLPEPPAPAGEAGTVYSAGRASRTFDSSAKATQPAVLAAFGDLQIQTVRRVSDSGMTVIEGTTADNRRASVSLRPQSERSTRLSARVGVFGDEPLSRAILDRVGVRLGELPPAAVPTEVPSAPSRNPFLNFGRSVGPDSEMLRDMADARFRDSPVP